MEAHNGRGVGTTLALGGTGVWGRRELARLRG